jgi:hypothetical protein
LDIVRESHLRSLKTMIYLLAGSVVFAGIFIYVLFMIFLPEWVGITGKNALENQKSHEGEKTEADALSKFLGDE